MAKLEPGFMFTGTLHNITAYRMKGVEQLILRTKGGPTKQQVKKSPQFERTRENNKEFGGRATAARWLKKAIRPIANMADHNLVSGLQKILLTIQQTDRMSERGKRNILFSNSGALLQGYSVNRKLALESVIRCALQCTTDRTTMTAHVDLPALVPGVNFFPASHHPMFGITLSLGILPDIICGAYQYEPVNGYQPMNPVLVETDWRPVLQGCPAQTVTLAWQQTVPATGGYTLVLGAGIRYGTIGSDEKVVQVRYAGTGKILRCF